MDIQRSKGLKNLRLQQMSGQTLIPALIVKTWDRDQTHLPTAGGCQVIVISMQKRHPCKRDLATYELLLLDRR